MPPAITENTLFYGDNLYILRDHIPDQSVDLIYLDPPFNSNRSYNVLFKEESGKASDAQIAAFDDTWHWGLSAEQTYAELVTSTSPQIGRMVSALREFIGPSQMLAYLVMMAARLVELHRVLKPTGSLYLHCDPTASHYLKIVLDVVFGTENFRNDIVWERYTRPKGSQFEARKFGVSTDNILFYSKSNTYKFFIDRIHPPLNAQEVATRYNLADEKGPFYSGPLLRSPSMGPRPNLVYEYKGFTPGPEGWRMTKDKLAELDNNGDMFWTINGIPRRKVRLDTKPVKPITNIWTDILAIGSQADERLGYPTQKPIALLERIIQASSNPGDIILDPFCGCGTAIAAAHKLGRRWIGIDITHLAISLQKYRLQDSFGLLAGKDYQVIGEPEDIGSARQLAADDKYQFQWWVLSLIGAKPLGQGDNPKQGKKGKDAGIDGVINFIDDPRGKLSTVIVQVKGGHVKSGDVRDLNGVLTRDKAVIGVFITLEPPTKDMLKEAATAGFYKSQVWQQDYPRIQILTVEQLLKGTKVLMPPAYGTFKKAERINKDDVKQSKFNL